MASVNKVHILGRLGANPELRYTASQVPVCTLSLATNEYWTDKEGNRQESTEWHRVVVWSKQAENCAKYLAKGREVYVEGRLQTRSWDDPNGQKRYSTEIVAQTVQFIGGGASTGGRDMGDPPPSHGDRPAGADAGHGASGFGSRMGEPGTPSLDQVPF